MLRGRLFNHAAIYTCSNFAVAGVPFLLLPVLTRALEPASYGLVAMFMLVVPFMAVGVGLNMHGAVTVRYFDRLNCDIREYVTTTCCISIASLTFITVLMLFFGEKLSEATSLPISWLFLALLMAFLQFVVQIMLVLWQASGKPIRYGALRISHALFDAIVSVGLVVMLSLSWQGRLSGLVLAWVFAAVLAGYFLFHEGWVAKVATYWCAKDALSFGLPLIPHALGGLLLGMADRFLVNTLIDSANAGVYMVAIQIGLALGLLGDSVNKAFAPWLMSKLVDIGDKEKRKIVKFTYLYFLMITLLAITGALISPFFLPYVVGEQYQEAGSLLIFVLLGNAFLGMYYMVTNYIFFKRKTGLLSLLTISIGVVSLVLTWFLIGAYGLKGAAIGFMIGQAALFLGAWVLSSFFVPMPWLKIFFRERFV